jgi:myo-inositol-1(or 4)-monophosphatase
VTPDLAELIEIVKESGALIPLLYKGGAVLERKLDGSLVTEVDQGIQQHIKSVLFAKWPQYGFIGEEMTHRSQVEVSESSKRGYWVLDPLDGTTNFTAGFLFYGISLALVVDSAPIVAVVFDPVRDECFSASRGKGAFLNGQYMRSPDTSDLADCVANVDYKRLVGDLAAQLVRCPPFRSQRNLGASVLEWCWLAAGRIQLYLHGGQKLWDFSAGYLILLEAGGAATSLSGLPLDCGSLRKRSVVAAVNPALLESWVEWIDANSDVSQSAPF